MPPPLHARPLDEGDLAPDPVAQFHLWMADARAAGVRAPEAMTLATATPDGAPSARMVLLKGADDRGFTFYTGYDSRKGRELALNPRAALVVYWDLVGRQVRVEGAVERVTPAETADYFATRPRGSRLGAWASRQSAVIPGRAYLEAALGDVERRFAGRDVPPPPGWGGFRVRHDAVEFWQHRDDRLHDRVRLTRDGPGWRRERLSP